MGPGGLPSIIALLIPLTVITGIFIVTPIAKALSKRSSTQVQVGGGEDVTRLANQLAATEERLDRIERSLRHLEEAQDFNRQLRSSSQSALSGEAPRG
jgi:hypothetical protein